MPRLRRLLAILGASMGLFGASTPALAGAPVAASALGDSCLLGSWVEVNESAPGNWTWNNQVIAVSGLAGLVITFRADGVEIIDLTVSQPLVGHSQGHEIKVLLRGTVAYHAYAAAGQLMLSAPAIDAQVTFYDNGAPQPGGSVAYASTATDTYTCSATRLRIESLATQPGYGPAVDDLARPGSAVEAALSAPGSVVSTVGTTLATPASILAAPLTLLASAFMALALVLLVTFPSHLFNRTFEENHDAIRAWWERRIPWLRRLRSSVEVRRRRALLDALGYVAVVVCGGVLAALLDPRFGLNLRTVALFAGAVLALVAGSIVSAGAAGVYRIARGRPGPWHLHALPSGIVIAALCVVISRVTDFQPGYLYGLIGGIAFSRVLSSREEGHVVAVTSIATMAVAISAWFLWVPVSSFSSTHPSNFGWALASNFLAALFVSGMVGLLIGLVPVRFLPGEKLSNWHRGVWGAMFGLAALAVIEVMLRPQSSAAHVAGVPFWTTAGLFVGFGTASILFWAYFKSRPSRVPDGDAGPG